MKKLAALISVLIFFRFSVFAISSASVYFASESDLRNMAESRGLETGDADSMRASIYEYEGLEEYVEEGGTASDFKLSILNAESIFAKDSGVIVSGNALISFVNDGSPATLSADTIVIDTEGKTVSALGGVIYESGDEGASLQRIEADIVSLKWESGEIKVTDGYTLTEKEDDEGESITIYTLGNTLTYAPGGSILYEKGRIASLPDEPHSSINASTIAMLPGSDMFVSNAYLSIGRVPVLWLPFFFFPGTRITGNPALGFTSSKGMFVNTTFEIFGHTDMADSQSSDSSSSFMSLLSSEEDDSSLLPDGSYYRSVTPSGIEEWAERTESHLALIADAYLETGVNFALDTSINLLGGSLKINAFNGIAFSDANSSYGYNEFRYYGENDINYSSHGIKAEISIPFYSDSRVLMDFGNRLSGFSILSLMQTPEFPQTYTSSISSFDRNALLSYTLPSAYRNKFIESLSVSTLKADFDYRWNSSAKEFYLKEAVIPSFSATMSGTIFGVSGDISSVINEEDEEEDITDRYLIDDPLLYDLYVKTSRAVKQKQGKKYSASLKYTLSESLNNNYLFNSDGSESNSKFSSTSSAKIRLSVEMADYVTLDASVTPSYYYLYEKNSSSGTIITEKGSIGSETVVALPFIGIEYGISSKLLSADTVTTEGVSERTWLDLGWNDDTVTNHYLAFTKSFVTTVGTFTPSLKYYIPPVTSTIAASFGYAIGPFALSFEWDFSEDSLTGKYASDDISLSLSWSSSHITSSLSLKYASEEFDGTDFFMPMYGTASLSLRSADKRWSITEYVDWDYYDSGSYNYFNNVTTTLKIPCFSIALDWSGPASDFKFAGVDAELDLNTMKFQFWKGRVYIALGLEASFYMETDNPYGASFEISPSITFSIAEFLDFTFSFNSVNNSFYEYYEDGKFSFPLMLKDLGRSLDFFGDGRYNTAFVFTSASMEVTHYMKDWNLNVKYSAVVSLVDDKYQFIPEFTVYLSWKTIPDLNIDQDWEQRNGKWSRN